MVNSFSTTNYSSAIIFFNELVLSGIIAFEKDIELA
jgi:hypothetical protein